MYNYSILNPNRSSRPTTSELYRTKLCKFGERCTYGSRCFYAHSKSEIRPRTPPSPRPHRMSPQRRERTVAVLSEVNQNLSASSVHSTLVEDDEIPAHASTKSVNHSSMENQSPRAKTAQSTAPSLLGAYYYACVQYLLMANEPAALEKLLKDATPKRYTD